MDFEIDYLDHVAIRVKDFDRSIAWYSKVLGLKKQNYEAWGDFPIFMSRQEFTVALFPAIDDIKFSPNSKHQKIDHFAFHVNETNFHKAQEYLKKINQAFVFQDHHYFHSIYLQDPDDHTVELTTTILNLSV